MKTIKLAMAALAATLCAFGAGESAAQAFPSKPIRLVVPFPPGGPTDAFARLLANRLQDTWKQPVIVESKPGAGTVVGTVARRPMREPRCTARSIIGRSIWSIGVAIMGREYSTARLKVEQASKMRSTP